MDGIHAAGGLDGVRAVRDGGCSARGAVRSAYFHEKEVWY
jgi:hypothetical protein